MQLSITAKYNYTPWTRTTTLCMPLTSRTLKRTDVAGSTCHDNLGVALCNAHGSIGAPQKVRTYNTPLIVSDPCPWSTGAIKAFRVSSSTLIRHSAVNALSFFASNRQEVVGQVKISADRDTVYGCSVFLNKTSDKGVAGAGLTYVQRWFRKTKTFLCHVGTTPCGCDCAWHAP